MPAALVVLVAAAVFTGIAAFAGGGLFALIILPIGIAVAVWLALAGREARGSSEIASDPDRPSLHGADSPDRP